MLSRGVPHTSPAALDASFNILRDGHFAVFFCQVERLSVIFHSSDLEFELFSVLKSAIRNTKCIQTLLLSPKSNILLHIAAYSI